MEKLVELFLHDAFHVGVGKEYQNKLYIKYSMYTHILLLLIKGCPFFRNLMFYATHYKSFGLGRTAFNESDSCISYILDYIRVYL